MIAVMSVKVPGESHVKSPTRRAVTSTRTFQEADRAAWNAVLERMRAAAAARAGGRSVDDVRVAADAAAIAALRLPNPAIPREVRGAARYTGGCDDDDDDDASGVAAAAAAAAHVWHRVSRVCVPRDRVFPPFRRTLRSWRARCAAR